MDWIIHAGRRSPLSIVLALSLLTCVSLQTHVPAQTEPASTLSNRVRVAFDKVVFVDAVRQLQERVGKSIFVDGEPQQKTISLEIEATAQQALDAVCNVFDFRWSLSKSGAILLTKRFMNQRELPQLNEQEMVQVSEESLRILRSFPYNPSVHPGDVLRNLARALPANVTAGLRAGQSLRIGDLEPRNRLLAEQAIYGAMIMQTYWAWDVLNGRLHNIADGEVHSEYLDERNPFTEEVFRRPFLSYATKDRSGRYYGLVLTMPETFIRRN